MKKIGGALVDFGNAPLVVKFEGPVKLVLG
jgi:hypothetical protein